MPDISMCPGSKSDGLVHTVCSRRETCYRFTAEPNPWRQSYFTSAPLYFVVEQQDVTPVDAVVNLHVDFSHKEVCEHYWPTSN